MQVLAISLGRNILKVGSREYLRMKEYAKGLGTLHIVVLTRREHGFSNTLHDGNLHIYPTNARTRVGMLLRAYTLGKEIIKNKGSDFVVSAQDPLEIGWLGYLLSWRTKAHLHIQVHGDYYSSDAWVGNSLFQRIRRGYALALLKRVSRIRVVSQRIKDSLINRGIRGEYITVLPIRPELEEFLSYTPCDRIQHTTCTFVTIGRLAPEKNIECMIRAFARLVPQCPTARLQIVGDGSEKKKIESLIETLGLENVVVLLPWTEHVPQVLCGADVFLLASKHEAYALTLIEAMATGMPLITTDVGCVGEVVEDKVHGIVVYDSSVEAYAEAMKVMCTDPVFREKCGKNGRETAERIAQQSATQYTQAWVNAISKL